MTKKKRGAGTRGSRRGAKTSLPLAEARGVSARDLIGLWAGSHRTLGLEASIPAIIERVRRYSLLEVMNAVGRISAVLHNSNSYQDSRVQLKIAAGLFGLEQARAIAHRLVLMRLRSRDPAEPTDPGPNFVLFGAPSLMALLQIAVVELPADGAPTGAPLDAMGEALLMLGDLVDKTGLTPVDADIETPGGRRRWVYYATTVASVQGGDPAVHLVVRAVELFLTDHVSLRGHEDYIDMPALFEEATGLTVEAYALALFFLVGTMYGIDAETVTPRSVMISKQGLMGGGLHFTPEQVDRLFALGGTDACEFVENARRYYRPGEIRPAFWLPFEQSPLVRFGSEAVCLSVRLLERRMTAGLYHILLNARPGPEHKKFRDRFMRYVGHVWANYVARSLTRIAQAECANRGALAADRKRHRGQRPYAYFLPEASLRAAVDASAAKGADTSSLCDGALVIGDTVLLVECKARMFSLAARAGTKEEEFFSRLDEIAVQGAAQLDTTLRHFVNGAFVGLGLDPARVRRVIPLIISLQDILLTPALRSWIEDRIREAGHLATQPSHVSVAPVELFDAGDLEWIELVVEQGGASMADIIRLRERDPVGRGHAFASWSMSVGVPDRLESARLTYHGHRFDELAHNATAFFRAHRVADAVDQAEDSG